MPTETCEAVPDDHLDKAGAPDMKLILDTEKCQGHGRCYALAPDLMDTDDYGQAVLMGDGSVAAASAADAQLIVDNCPEYAITVSGD